MFYNREESEMFYKTLEQARMMFYKTLCFLGRHNWERRLNEEHFVSERYCTRCPKRQWWASYGFPAYYGEWRDL